MNTQLCVLGAGPGGYAAAFLAADLGMQITLVDLEPRLGGVCLLRGCIPSKALLHVAKVMAEARQLAEWGVAFGPPTIDVAAVRTRKEKVIATLTGGLAMLARKRNVNVIRARARFENSQTLKLESVDGTPLADDRVSFDHCIVATGSSPTRIPAFDLPTHRVMDSTGALMLPDVPESLLVVGGGYIGLEMGTVYAALGSRVSVVELTDGLLPGVDRELVKPLQKRLAGLLEGIYLNTKVVALADQEDAIEVSFEGEVPEKTRRYSRVLLSVGRQPNTADLGLEKTNVQLDPRLYRRRWATTHRRSAHPGHWRRGRRADVGPQGKPRGQGGRRGFGRQAGNLPAAGHSGRRLYRPGNRLGGADGNRGQAAGTSHRNCPVPLGSQRPRSTPSAAPRD